jgi:hypothetical protein
MKLGITLLAAGAALAASMPIRTEASSISTDATYYSYVHASARYDQPGQFKVSNNGVTSLSVTDGSASASTANNYSTPSISSSVSSGAFLAAATAESGLTYYFTINGPDAASLGTTTKVKITASGYVHSTGSAGGSGFLSIGPAENASTFVRELMTGGGGNSALLSFSDTFDLTVGAIYKVIMTTHVVVNDVGTVTAYLDPYIQTLQSGYTVSTFGGIGNSAVAPIPATLLLFLSGLGVLGLAAHRKKNAAAPAN